MADIGLIKPRELPEQTNVQPADVLMVDNGVIVGKATLSQIVNAGVPVASEAEAIAGIDNSKRITPLRLRQVMDNTNNPAILRAQAWAESPTAPDPLLPDTKSAKTWATVAQQAANFVTFCEIMDEGQTVLTVDHNTGEPIRAFDGVVTLSFNGFGPLSASEYSVDPSTGVITLTDPAGEGDLVTGHTLPRIP